MSYKVLQQEKTFNLEYYPQKTKKSSPELHSSQKCFKIWAEGSTPKTYGATLLVTFFDAPAGIGASLRTDAQTGGRTDRRGG